MGMNVTTIPTRTYDTGRESGERHASKLSARALIHMLVGPVQEISATGRDAETRNELMRNDEMRSRVAEACCRFVEGFLPD
jgi:hypothetical protein